MIASGGPHRPSHALVGRLSAVELRAAMLDGELQRVDDGFAPVDLPVTAERRAEALGRSIGDPRVIVSDRSAAWVWGWLLSPPGLSTSVSIAARVPSPDRRRLGAREVVIDPDEILTLAGIAITSPMRTLIDLARHDAGHEVDELLLRGVREHSIPFDDLIAALDRRPRLSFVRVARERLARVLSALESQPLLTR